MIFDASLGYLLTILAVGGTLLFFVSIGVDSEIRMKVMIAVYMVLIALFAPKLFSLEIGGFKIVSNVANVFYAFVFCAMTITAVRYGESVAWENVPIVLWALIIAFTMSFLLGQLPLVLPEREIGKAIAVLSRHQAPVVIASFLAFTCAQAVLLLIIRHVGHNWRGIVAGTVFGQITDSALFFPIAFSDLSIDTMASIAVTGLVVKLIAAIFLAPVYIVACRRL